jgi:nucleoside-diphosphate-sugar epimerase
MPFRTIVVFGGDSDAGYTLTVRAIGAGYRVLSVITGPRDLDYITRAGAQSVRCDPTDRAAVDAVFAGLDGRELAVVSILGGSPQVNSEGNINVIDAAVAAGVRRFVLTTSIGCNESSAIMDPMLRAVAGRAIRAKEWAENHLRSTDLEWTIVRPGSMTRRTNVGAPLLTDNVQVTGSISLIDLGEMLYVALQSPRAVHRALAALDSGRAYTLDGGPLVPAEL